MLFRRLFIPALVGVPLMQWAATLAFRSDPFQIVLPNIGDLAFGLLLNSIGIVAACWPTERLVSHYDLRPSAKLALIILGGAAGGFLMGSVLAGLAWKVGLLGILPGAAVALVWALFNLDLLARKKDIPLG